jgi:hypothetical protein
MCCWWTWQWTGIQNWRPKQGIIAHVLAMFIIILPWKRVELIVEFGLGRPVEIPEVTNVKKVLGNLKWCRWVESF